MCSSLLLVSWSSKNHKNLTGLRLLILNKNLDKYKSEITAKSLKTSGGAKAVQSHGQNQFFIIRSKAHRIGLNEK